MSNQNFADGTEILNSSRIPTGIPIGKAICSNYSTKYIPCIGAEDGVWEDGVSGVTNGYEVVLEADLNVLRRWSPGGPSAKPVMKPKLNIPSKY